MVEPHVKRKVVGVTEDTQAHGPQGLPGGTMEHTGKNGCGKVKRAQKRTTGFVRDFAYFPHMAR
jgi:hypothetical protein